MVRSLKRLATSAAWPALATGPGVVVPDAGAHGGSWAFRPRGFHHRARRGVAPLPLVALPLLASLAMLLILALPALAAGSAAASSEPARLSGDKVTVDLEARLARAEGNVVLTYKDLRITCEVLEVNTSSGELVATGHVELHDGDDVVTGDVLRYNLNERRGSITHGQASVTGEGIEGKIYVSGQAFASEPGKLTVTGGSFTTCDLEEPHYHVEAGEIEVYVDDRIVLRNVSYWEGKLRLFYWPYLVLPIREENAFELPKIGYGPTEGWFVKTTYNYYRSPSSRGSLYLDYLSRLGVGAGVKHIYKAGTLGSGFVYVYGIANSLAGLANSKFEISHDIEFGGGTGAHLDLRYSDTATSEGAVSNKELKGVVQLSQNDEQGSASVTVERTAEWGSAPSDETRVSASVSRRMAGGLSLSGNATYLNYSVPGGDADSSERFLNYKVDISKDTSVGSLRSVWEQYVKPREREEQEEEGEVEPLPYEAIGRAPEVTFESKPFRLGSVPLDLRVTAAYGRYSERPSGWAYPGTVKAARTELGLVAPPKSYALWSGARATVSGGLVFDSYTTGQERAVASANLTMETGVFGNALRLKGGYEYCGVFGDTPFAFDEKTREGLISGSLTFSRSPLTFSVEGGYDLYTQEYKDFVGRLRISPRGAWAVEAQATYDPDQAAMKEAIGKIEISPSERGAFKLGGRYSFPKQALDRIESDVELNIGDAWKVQWTVVYGGPSKGVLQGNVGVTRDLHCRELKISYSYTDNQVWLEYRIKAFPYEGIRFGLGDQGVLF
ncbi:MAG: hypothetical protein ACM3X3_08640 [Betaproteobacteria bacterium]